MRAFLAAVAAALLIIFPVLAIAQDGSTSTVTVPLGDLVASVANYAGTILVAVAMWALRKLPSQLYSIVVTLRVEQLLGKAVDFGINAVRGATTGKTLSVDVSVPVLAQALQYALDRIPGWLLSWVGGPEAVAEMLWARLDLPADAAKPDFSSIVDSR